LRRRTNGLKPRTKLPRRRPAAIDPAIATEEMSVIHALRDALELQMHAVHAISDRPGRAGFRCSDRFFKDTARKLDHWAGMLNDSLTGSCCEEHAQYGRHDFSLATKFTLEKLASENELVPYVTCRDDPSSRGAPLYVAPFAQNDKGTMSDQQYEGMSEIEHLIACGMTEPKAAPNGSTYHSRAGKITPDGKYGDAMAEARKGGRNTIGHFGIPEQDTEPSTTDTTQ